MRTRCACCCRKGATSTRSRRRDARRCFWQPCWATGFRPCGCCLREGPIPTWPLPPPNTACDGGLARECRRDSAVDREGGGGQRQRRRRRNRADVRLLQRQCRRGAIADREGCRRQSQIEAQRNRTWFCCHLGRAGVSGVTAL